MLNNLWIYLIEKNLNIDVFGVNQLLKCSICEGILKQAMISKCGCVFCNDCITDYLDDQCKQCPGCSKESINTELIYNRDISEDPRSNREIFKLVVTCPHDGCNEKHEMRMLLNHLLVCRMKIDFCIFNKVGCVSPVMKISELDVHLEADKRSHYQMILDNLILLKSGMEKIQEEHGEFSVIRNEIAQLKKENSDMKVEIETVTQTTINLKDENEELNLKLITMESEMKILIHNNSDQIKALKEENEELGETINSNKKEILKIIEDNTELSYSIHKDTNSLKELVRSNQSDFDDLRTAFGCLQEDHRLESSATVKGFVVKPKEKELDVDEMISSADKCSEKMDIKKSTGKQIGNLGAIALQRCSSSDRYKWKPDQLSQRPDKIKLSDSFTMSGYYMNLRLMWSNNKMWVELYLMRSIDDVLLIWPMNLHLRLTVMDPESGDVMKSEETLTSNGKPSVFENWLLGIYDIILDGFTGVTRSDSILIVLEVV